MKKLLITFTAFLIVPPFAQCETYISGNIGDAVWTIAGSPYILTGNLEADSLTIEAGVHVQADYYAQITINEHLAVNGTETDSVVFTSGQTSWKKIYFDDFSSAQISYAVFENISSESSIISVGYYVPIIIKNSFFGNVQCGTLFSYITFGSIENCFLNNITCESRVINSANILLTDVQIANCTAPIFYKSGSLDYSFYHSCWVFSN